VSIALQVGKLAWWAECIALDATRANTRVPRLQQHASSAKSVSTKAPRQGLSQRHAPIVPQDFTPLALETSDVPVVIMASLLLRRQQPPVLVVPLENMPPQSGPQLVPTAQQGILLVLLDIASARGVARVPSRRLLRPQRVLGVPRVSTRAALAAQHAPHAAMVSTLALVLLSAAIVLMEKSRPGEAPVQPVLSAKTVTTAKHRPAMTAQLASTQVPQGV